MAREMVKLHASKEEIDTDWRYTPVPTLSKFILQDFHTNRHQIRDK